MKKYIFLFIKFFTLLLLLASCNTIEVNKKLLDNSNILTIENSGKEFATKVNSEFKIKLNIESMTGYKWDIVNFNQSIISLQKSTYEKESDSFRALACKTFFFKAISKGKTTLKIKYHKPWDQNAVSKIFKLDISIL